MTKPVPLSRHGGELLLRVLEQRKSSIAASVLQDSSPDLLAELVRIGALQQGSVARAVIVQNDDEPAFRELIWQDDLNAYGYFDAADGRLVVAHEALPLYGVSLPWWLAWLADTLDLTNAGRATELVPGFAWDIGDLWVSPQRKVPILFARRLYHSETFAALRETLRQRSGRSGGLILNSGRTPTSDALIQNFIVVPISKVLTNGARMFSIDRSLLLSPFVAARTAPIPTEPLYLSPDGKLLIINGVVKINFKSNIHIKLIRQLIDGYREGKRWRASELLDRSGSGVTTLQRGFGRQKWKKLEPYLTSQDGLWGFDI